jgi:hypothetical protein
MELLRKREGDYHLWLKNTFSGGSFGLMPCHESGTFHYKLQTNFEGVSYYRFIEGGSLVDQGIVYRRTYLRGQFCGVFPLFLARSLPKIGKTPPEKTVLVLHMVKNTEKYVRLVADNAHYVKFDITTILNGTFTMAPVFHLC